MTLSRRQLLSGLAFGAAAAVLRPRWALGLGPRSKFRLGRLVLSGNREPHPTALRRLLWEIDKRTSIDPALDPLDVRPEIERLHQTPFLTLAGDRAFTALSPREVAALRRFLTFGGFLLIDSAEGRIGGEFDGSVRRLVADLFPTQSTGLEPVPGDHVLYKSFYLLDKPEGRLLIAPQLEAVFRGGRAAIVYCQNDLGGAWARDDYGNWEHACYPGGEVQREHAFRLGVNLAMYALCLDYKTDQVHVPFILKRRQWRPDPGEP